MATEYRETVLAELGNVFEDEDAKVVIRLVRASSNPKASPILDIREYVHTETFTGWTRRGLRLTETMALTLFDKRAAILSAFEQYREG